LPSEQPSRRSTQRERTKERILASARDLFSSFGYSATTVRAIAEGAQTDPALVVRYFGSKAALFDRATDLGIDDVPPEVGDGAASEFLASLRLKLDSVPASLLAGLRSVLAHPSAGTAFTDAVRTQQSQVATEIGGADAELRAGLLGALTLGIVLARYVLDLEGVRDADADQMLSLVARYVDELVEGQPTKAKPRQ
jgi:AcrR family transcriptional regulator